MKAFESARNRIAAAFRGAMPFRGVRAGVAAGLLLALAGNAGAAEFPQGLMLQFNFDEVPSFGVIPDRSGRGHEGRAIGVTWTNSGKRGGGLVFASSNQYIVVSNTAALSFTQATYTLWFRTSASNAAACALLDTARAPGCVLGIAGETPEAKHRGRLYAVVGGQSCLGDKVISDGAWHHAAATFAGESLRLYVDGQLQKQAPAQVARAPAAGGIFVIGMTSADTDRGGKGRSFHGTIDDVMIFNHALTDAEVGAVMAFVKPKFSRDEGARRVAELKGLLDRGLILQEFYDRKVKEWEVDP